MSARPFGRGPRTPLAPSVPSSSRARRTSAIAQAPTRVPAETALDEAAQGRGRVGGKSGVVDLALEDLREGLGDAGPPKRAPTGEHLVEHRPEGPHVGLPVDGEAAGLLRAHIGGGAHDGACGRGRPAQGGGVGQILAGVAGRDAAEAEIKHLDRAVAPQRHVGRLEVAVRASSHAARAGAQAQNCGAIGASRASGLRPATTSGTLA